MAWRHDGISSCWVLCNKNIFCSSLSGHILDMYEIYMQWYPYRGSGPLRQMLILKVCDWLLKYVIGNLKSTHRYAACYKNTCGVKTVYPCLATNGLETNPFNSTNAAISCEILSRAKNIYPFSRQCAYWWCSSCARTSADIIAIPGLIRFIFQRQHCKTYANHINIQLKKINQ